MADTLTEFLKEQENAPLAAGHLSSLRHASPEGGTDTIGFGHKLTPEEIRVGKVHGVPLDRLDMAAAEHILQVDILQKRQTLDRSLQQRHGVALDDLSPRKQMMLLDMEFNLGSAAKVFPTFTGAVIAGDDKVMKDEFERSFTDAKGRKRPLARNAPFYNTFLSNAAKEQLGE